MSKADQPIAVHLDQHDLRAIVDALYLYHTFLVRTHHLYTIPDDSKLSLTTSRWHLHRLHVEFRALLNTAEDES